MSARVSHALTRFVPRSGETWRDPFEMYTALRENDPVHHVASDDYWDADELDVTGDPRMILTFAHGAHHCLGAAAARMMGRVALDELLSRIPDFRVDLDAVTWAEGNYVRRPTAVPLEVL